MRPERRICNDHELVVVAQIDAVYMRIWNDVWVKIRTAKKTCTASCSVHLSILHVVYIQQTAVIF